MSCTHYFTRKTRFPEIWQQNLTGWCGWDSEIAYVPLSPSSQSSSFPQQDNCEQQLENWKIQKSVCNKCRYTRNFKQMTCGCPHQEKPQRKIPLSAILMSSLWLPFHKSFCWGSHILNNIRVSFKMCIACPFWYIIHTAQLSLMQEQSKCSIFNTKIH